jgi:glycosyltransferase involved in cell wall biosynthesis
MRIGFDGKRFFHNNTGLGNYSRSLIKVLSEYLPENEYLLYNPKKSSNYSLKNFNKSVIEVNPENYLSIRLKSLWRLYFVSNKIKEQNLAIYHGLSGEIPLGLPNNIKKVVTIHDLIFVRYPNLYSYFDRKIHFLKFKYAAKKSNVVVAISQQTKNDIVTYLGIKEDKIKVIYQGCNAVFKQTFTEAEINSTLIKYNLSENYILNVGTIEKRKNLLTILKSITNTNKNLVVIGKKTDYFNEIWTYIVSNNLEKQVLFLKNLSLEEMAMIYQKATLFVYPSIFEGFGIPIIEALYSKTPVITSTGSCFSEAGGSHSIYINPESSEELKEAINLLWDNPSKRKEMQEKGFEFVQKFNDEVIAKNWNELYQSLV